MPGSFVDTNVLVYLASGTPSKADRAERILADDAIISVQVLNELTNVARRKMHLPWDELHSFLSTIRALVSIQPVTLDTHDIGLGLSERYGFATFDAMIVAAALQAGSETLWSEDMQHGLTVEGRLKITNPFV